MRKALTVLLLLLLLPFSFVLAENTALLIGCDTFAEAENTTPASFSNVERMSDVLTDYRIIKQTENLPTSGYAFRRMVLDAFSDCTDDDTLLLYFSTHGVETENGIRLVLSDGETDYGVSAEELNKVLQMLPGKKILIIDCCYSGAFIARGSSTCSVVSPITEASVFTSAGAEEQSWFYYDEGSEGIVGGGYFTSALADGLDPVLGCEADENRDGNITLSELERYLQGHYAAATPWLYSRNKEMVIQSASREGIASVTGIQCENKVLTQDLQTSVYSFAIQKETKLSWALVYYQNNAWQFPGAQIMPDTVESNDGIVSPGYKTRSVGLNQLDSDDSGFVMMLLLSHENGQTRICGATAVTAMKNQGEIGLSVTASPYFCPEWGEEAAIAVKAEEPCQITVTVENEDGDTVSYLAYRESIKPGGSYFYWDGSDAETGEYIAHITAKLPEATEETEVRIQCISPTSR